MKYIFNKFSVERHTARHSAGENFLLKIKRLLLSPAPTKLLLPAGPLLPRSLPRDVTNRPQPSSRRHLRTLLLLCAGDDAPQEKQVRVELSLACCKIVVWCFSVNLSTQAAILDIFPRQYRYSSIL